MPPEPSQSLSGQLAAMRADVKAMEGRLRGTIGREMDAFSEKWGVPISYIETPVECYQPYGQESKRSVLGQVKVSCSLP
jgi:hypothetical protein